ncbi:hypothetical protein APSETT444_002019 [Aspergillus pseudonomiae]
MAKIPALLRSCAPSTGGSSSKVSVSIHIAGAENSRPMVFTTLDKIEGVVTITVAEKTACEDIKITLEGISRVATWGGINGPPLIGGRHTFMKLHNLIEKGPYQPASILEPGWCYKFPFTFIVPENLPLTACDHTADDGGLQNTHTRLPPSMCKETDTECFSIKYIVRVVIPKPFCGKESPKKSIATAVQPVKIVLSGILGSSSGISINGLTSRRVLRIRRGWRGKCSGHLTILASPTEPIRLPFRRINAVDQVNTPIKLDLRFTTVGTQPPPHLRKMYPKLNSVTSFHAGLQEQYPSFTEDKSTDLARGNHVQSLTLPTIDIASTQWAKIQSPSASISSSQPSDRSISTNEEASYTASIVVPISIPKDEDLVPKKAAGGRAAKIEVPVEIIL